MLVTAGEVPAAIPYSSEGETKMGIRNVKKLDFPPEQIIEINDGEDQLIETVEGWWWQTRGTDVVVGPFEDRAAAERDCSGEDCLYCGKNLRVTDDQTVPGVDDDDSWEDLAKDHETDCEWIATRAHQREGN